MIPKINDGLNKWQRYRLKDIDAYRTKKRNYSKTLQQREYRKKYMRKWREKNHGKYLAWTREHHRKNRDKYRAYTRAARYKKLYGITIDERESMIEKQNYMCLICGHNFKSQRHAHLDHCHTTGRLRGILCSKCNGNLGWFEMYSTNIHSYLETVW
jgi:hypothetical protein